MLTRSSVVCAAVRAPVAAWNTWTSTPYPPNSSFAYTVSSSGTSNFAVADNFPGWALCTAGSGLAVTSQPNSQAVALGQPATFSVTASGTDPLAYQWFKNGTAISGATAASYTTPATVSGDNGAQFYVVVTDAASLSTTSNTVVLTLSGTAAAGPVITTQPTSQSVAVGQAAIAGPRDHLAVAHHHGADRHLAGRRCGAGLLEREVHEGRCGHRRPWHR